jgi:hypothetical protein
MSPVEKFRPFCCQLARMEFPWYRLRGNPVEKSPPAGIKLQLTTVPVRSTFSLMSYSGPAVRLRISNPPISIERAFSFSPQPPIIRTVDINSIIIKVFRIRSKHTVPKHKFKSNRDKALLPAWQGRIEMICRFGQSSHSFNDSKFSLSRFKERVKVESVRLAAVFGIAFAKWCLFVLYNDFEISI